MIARFFVQHGDSFQAPMRFGEDVVLRHVTLHKRTRDPVNVHCSQRELVGTVACIMSPPKPVSQRYAERYDGVGTEGC